MPPLVCFPPGGVDMASLLSCLVFAAGVAWPVFLNFPNTEYFTSGTGSSKTRPKMGCRLPPLLFQIVWPFLYACIITAGVLHILSVPSVAFALDGYYVAAIVCVFVNITLNHLWSVVAFKFRKLLLSLVISVGLVITAAAVAVLYALSAGGCPKLWASFGLWMPYTVWLVIAMVLNFIWYMTEKKVAP